MQMERDNNQRLRICHFIATLFFGAMYYAFSDVCVLCRYYLSYVHVWITVRMGMDQSDNCL